jgi:hypothetical protein
MENVLINVSTNVLKLEKCKEMQEICICLIQIPSSLNHELGSKLLCLYHDVAFVT